MRAVCLVASVLIGSLWGPEHSASAHVAATLLLVGPTAYWKLRGTLVRLVGWAALVGRPAIASLLMAGLLASMHGQLVAYGGPAIVLVRGAAIGMLAYLGTWLLLPGGRAEFAEFVRHVTAMVKNRTA